MDSFDVSRLRQGERIAGAAGVVLFIVMFFFKWFGLKGTLGNLVTSAGYSGSFNAWHAMSITRWLLLLTVIVAVGGAFVTATNRTVALPVALSVLTAASGILVSVLVFYRVVISHPGSNDVIGTKFGAWLGLLACIAIAVGGWLSMQDEDTSFGQAVEDLQNRPAPPA